MSRQPPEKLSIDFLGHWAGLAGANRLSVHRNHRNDFGGAAGEDDFGGGQQFGFGDAPFGSGNTGGSSGLKQFVACHAGQ